MDLSVFMTGPTDQKSQRWVRFVFLGRVWHQLEAANCVPYYKLKTMGENKQREICLKSEAWKELDLKVLRTHNYNKRIMAPQHKSSKQMNTFKKMLCGQLGPDWQCLSTMNDIYFENSSLAWELDSCARTRHHIGTSTECIRKWENNWGLLRRPE